MAEEIDPFDRLRGVSRSSGPWGPDTDDPLLRLPRPRPGHALTGRLRERVEPWLAWFGVRRLVGVVVTTMAVVAGGWWLLRAPAPPTEARLPFAAAASSSPSSPSSVPSTVPGPSPPTTLASSIVVHVAGAVLTPGVYELPAAARVGQAVTAAGGPAPDADVDALNLAAPLRDGERVYVPIAGEEVPPPIAVPGTAAGSAVATAPIDLNRAGAAELDGLPGIGPATAEAIVSHREANGPFASVDDLEQVRGIGPAKLEAIRPLVTV